MNGQNHIFIENWRKYVEKRGKEVGKLSGPWKNGNLISGHQKDGHSCGPFVLMNALALSKGIMPSYLSQKCALMMRQYVTSKIVRSAKEPKSQRTMCDMLECNRPSKDSWVQCKVCGKWLHFTCVNLKSASDSEYLCIICDAQYQ
ncbi:uncharacterized protein LOC127726069 [Mytilus californianus]|uniref:uncharacterized protein LOC127726069 n=1 Tax=Mytilus californianus TaxID=6549 RepID=UPI002245BAA3|nr:uncharacterized protein LOC127726069 [Mytilus californianus]